jgi:transposase
MLLPPSLEELITPNHPVLVVDKVVDSIDLAPLLKKYKGGGCSSFHPRMLLKVLIYAYISNIYSSRKIESALKENIHFMWLSGMSKPDHNTINRFRSERLKDVLKTLFAQVVLLLNEEGLLNIKELYTDGTKIEANANKYSFVWGKAAQKSKARIANQLDDIWKYAQSIAKDELEDMEPTDFTAIDSEKVSQTIEKINQAIGDKPIDKKVKQKLNYAKRNWPKKLDEYKHTEEILNKERNSYSKTDNDATFMRMKEDHMKNGQLKPGYNVQVSSNNQFIVHYSIHPNPTDTKTLAPHLKTFEYLYHQKPNVVTADAGYGSEENYELLSHQNIAAFVKFNTFDKEQKTKLGTLKQPFPKESLHYNDKDDYYVCPMGQHMTFIGTKKDKSSTGFEQAVKLYKAQNCYGCPLKSKCYKSESTDRIIQRNINLEEHKTRARNLLLSEEGVIRRKQRVVDTEPIFGNIKHNKGFKRFMLRGKHKVEIEWGLLALAHNLKKKAAA